MKVKKVFSIILSIMMMNWFVPEISTTTTATTTTSTSSQTSDRSYADSIKNSNNREVLYDGSMYITSLDPNSANVKPLIAIEKKSINKSEAGNVQIVNISVTGANRKYAEVGLHFIYDKRLKVVANNDGEVVTYNGMLGFQTLDLGDGELYVSNDGSKDKGTDGENVWQILFLLPSDAKEGDTFPIGIEYKNETKYGDHFTSALKDADGKLINTKKGLPIPIVSSIVSPKYAEKLCSYGIDTASVGTEIGLSVAINTIISMVHRMFYDESADDPKLYQVRTRKIILYSNSIASISNVIATAFTKDLRKLDVGGLIVTIARLFCDIRFITRIKQEYIDSQLDINFKGITDEIDEMYNKVSNINIQDVVS